MANGLLGTDIEVWAYDKKNKEIIPGFFALGGDVDIDLPFGKCYPDGAAVEFTVEPSNDARTITRRIFENVGAIRTILKEKHGPQMEVGAKSHAFIGKKWIDQLPEEYGKRASLQIFGCNKDEVVYPWIPEIDRPDPKTYEYRTLGGHIHIELPEQIRDDKVAIHLLVGWLDAGLGTWFTRWCNAPEDNERRKVYGLAGTIRLKPYGLEYRTPPSRALVTDADYTEAIFGRVHDIVQHFLYNLGSNNDYKKAYDAIGGISLVRSAVNSINTGRDSWSVSNEYIGNHYVRYPQCRMTFALQTGRIPNGDYV